MATRIVRKRSVQSGFGSSTGSRITQNRRSRVSEGYGAGENRLRAQQSAGMPIDTARFGGTFDGFGWTSVHGCLLSQQQEDGG